MWSPVGPPGRRAALLLAILVFLLSAALARGGLFSSADPGDVGRYHDFAELLTDGQLPYRDFYMEYPPGAVPFFLAPELLPGDNYNLTFKLLAVAAGIGILISVWAALGLLRAGPGRTAFALGLVAVMPAALGAVVLNRYDVWPVLLVMLALVALLAGRDRLGFGFLAAGAAVKLFPAALLPLAALHVLRTRGRGALVRALVAFGAVFCLLVLPLAAIAPGGFGYSVKTQLVRQLQLESLAASLLLAADKVGLYTARIVAGKPGSLDLGGALPDALGVLTSAALLAALAFVLLEYWRADESLQLLATGFAAAVTAIVVLSKVVSPQFLIWIVPLVPLVAGRLGRLASALLLAALVATQVEVVYEHPLRAGEWPVWVLLGRNLLLVGVLAALLAALRAHVRRA
jgi:hypothetical protein